MVSFEVRRVTAIEACDFYYQYYPDKICHLRSDMLGYVLNYANVSFESRVLLVENTRGMMAGAVAERGINYCMRVEFNQDLAVKNRNEILYEMDISSGENKAVSTISASLLVPNLKMSSGATNTDEMLLPMMQKKYRRSFNSFIFVHDALHPVEIFEALREYLQPSASFAIYSTYLQPLS